MFNCNTAKIQDGGIVLVDKSNVKIKRNSVVSLERYQVFFGGAMMIKSNCNLLFCKCTAVFNGNEATMGGAVCIMLNSGIMFSDDSSITIVNNNINPMAGGGIITQDKSDNPVIAWLNFKISFKIV